MKALEKKKLKIVKKIDKFLWNKARMNEPLAFFSLYIVILGESSDYSLSLMDTGQLDSGWSEMISNTPAL